MAMAIWRASQAINAPEAAPVLVFAVALVASLKIIDRNPSCDLRAQCRAIDGCGAEMHSAVNSGRLDFVHELVRRRE